MVKNTVAWQLTTQAWWGRAIEATAWEQYLNADLGSSEFGGI